MLDRLAALDSEMGAVGDRLVGKDADRQAEALLELGEVRALLVQDVEGHLRAGAHHEMMGARRR